MRTRHDLLTGAAATVTLLVLVVGVPVALTLAVGWPLPRALPSPDAVVTALRYGRVPSSTVLNSLAVVLWVVWMLTVISIGGEVVAVAKGTVAQRLPGLSGLQALATRLVAAGMLLLPMAGRAVAAPAPPPVPVVAAEAEATPAKASEEAPARGHAMWTVQPRDSLWTIAEQALGDGRRWQELLELNVDRAQPDGGRLRAGDTLIHPGWKLALPPDARPPTPTPASVRVARGDDLWELAERYLDDGDRWPELYEANRGRRQPDGRRLTDPDLIRPGWELVLPARAARAGSDAPPVARGARDDDAVGRPSPGPLRSGPKDDAPSRTVPHADTPRHHRSPQDGDLTRTEPRANAAGPHSPGAGVAGPDTSDTDATDAETAGADAADPETSSDDAPVAGRPVTPSTVRQLQRAGSGQIPARDTAAVTRPDRSPAHEALAIAGAAVLAAGLVGLIARRRRHWLRRRAQASVAAPVDPETAELERWLRSMADHDLAQRVDLVARLLADLLEGRSEMPPITAIELGERTVVHLAAAHLDPPEGLTADDDARRWLLAPECEVMQPDAARRHLAALVSCGRTDDGALVLSSLCGGGALGLSGADPQVREVLTSWTAELASTGADVGVQLVVAGPHDPLVERLARVAIVDGPDAAVARVRRLLDEAADDRDGHVVVLCGAAPPGPALAELVHLAGDARVAVVLPSEATPRQLVLGGDRVRLEPEGWSLVTPRWLTPDDWDRFGDLLRQPAPSYAPELLPSPLAAPGAPLDWATVLDDDPEEAPVIVGLLGSLLVNDVPVPLGVDAASLLTWLSVHRTGADPATIHATLWPTAVDGDGRLTAAVDELTALLLDRVHGPLVHTDDGRVELADTIGTDLARFDTLVRRLDTAPPATQARRLTEALALVRGEPLSDGADWAQADGLAVATAARVTEVAHRLAMHALAVLDVDRATWAVEQGLRAVPGCELLFRDRMRIADACGDPAGVDAALEELHGHLDGAWPAAETERLHRQLRRPTRVDASDDLPDAM